MSAKVTVVAPTLAAAQQVARDVAALAAGAQVSVQAGGAEVACRDVMHSSPDLLVVELPSVDAADLRQFETSLAGRPMTCTILLTPDRSPETLLGAMRAGVREIVPTPLANGELKEAIARQVERLHLGRAGTRRDGQVMAFMPTKGGAGATFLATSLGHALSQRDKRVLVIDLNLHLGDAVIFVSDQPVTTTLADLAAQQQRLDGALLESMAIKCAERLWVLASPESPDAAVGVRAETVARIVELARERFDFVVLDLGRVPDAVTLRALDAAHTVYLVAQGTLPFLHDGKRLMNLLRELGYPQDKLQLVINRVEKGGDLAPSDVRRVMAFDSAREIPNSYAAVAYAINHGLPLLRHAPRDPVARALLAWADEWVPAAAGPERAGGGWLRGLGIGRS
jgi:pilus assembly protein CpaE